MNTVFLTVDDEGLVEIVYKDDAVNLIVVNKDHLEDYIFLYDDEEVIIDSVDEEDGTCTLLGDDGNSIMHNVPVERLSVIDGEEYLG